MASTTAVSCNLYSGAVVKNCLSCAFGFNLCCLPLENFARGSRVTLRGRKDNGAMRIVDAHRDDRKRLVVLGDEILTALFELGSADSGRVKVTITLRLRRGAPKIALAISSASGRIPGALGAAGVFSKRST